MSDPNRYDAGAHDSSMYTGYPPIIEREAQPAIEVDPNIPTRARVQEQRRAETIEGFKFPLLRTGGYARVRLLSIQDRAAIGRLPQAMQNKVNKMLTSGAQNNGRIQTNDILKTLDDKTDVADAFCVIGFITPRLVATPDEVDPNDPYCMWVGDLHVDERNGYLMHVMNIEGVQAKKLEPFRI